MSDLTSDWFNGFERVSSLDRCQACGQWLPRHFADCILAEPDDA